MRVVVSVLRYHRYSKVVLPDRPQPFGLLFRRTHALHVPARHLVLSPTKLVQRAHALLKPLLA